jgi:hypothetical protein
MKIFIAFCLPLLVSAQSFVITQHTSLSISYEPIALIRVQAPTMEVATEAPSEAGEGFLGSGQSVGQIELLMSISKHGPKDVLGRLLNLPPLRILCSVSGQPVYSGNYQGYVTVQLDASNQPLLHIPDGLCTGLNQGVPIEFKLEHGTDYTALHAAQWWLNLQYVAQ